MPLQQEQEYTSYIFQDAAECLSLINDHSAQLSMVMQSNCTKNLIKRAQIFFDKLQQLADFIVTWMDCQTKWIYIISVIIESALMGRHVRNGDLFRELSIKYQSLVNTLFENMKTLHLIGVRVEDNFQLQEESSYLIGRILTLQKELSQAMMVNRKFVLLSFILQSSMYVNLIYQNAMVCFFVCPQNISELVRATNMKFGRKI